MNAVWRLPDADADAQARLIEAFGFAPAVATILAGRGLTDVDAVQGFLNPSLDDLCDPSLLPDYSNAVSAILGARERGERIFVHGDYDADGVTSTALFTRFLGKIGCHVTAHVPHREKEGYGIHLEAVRHAANSGAKLFLTCDCGATAHEQVELARELGLDVVVTDHHTLEGTLPRAHAVVNPHRADSEYPFKDLSGVGVVFKLCTGITRELGLPIDAFYRAYLDLAVLGTVADVMPLVGENRILTAHGLKRLTESQKPGIVALLRESGLVEKAKKGLKASHIGFQLGPRLNAAGRIDDAALALRLLITQDAGEAAELARSLELLNERRRSDQESIVAEAIARVEAEGLGSNAAIVIVGEGWHPGIIGIVAGKLRERYYRPVFVATVDPESGAVKGSARSIQGFNLAEAIRAHPEILDGGGHAMAAGFSTSSELMPEVQRSLLEYAVARLAPEDLVPTVRVDAAAGPEELTFETARWIERIEPFGTANPTPTIAVDGARIEAIVPTRNPEHPTVMLRFDSRPLFRSPAFGLGERLTAVVPPLEAKVLLQSSVDEWNGETRAQWILKDFQAA